MKYTAFLAAFAALLIANQSVNAQGTLTPPGAPAESQKSLQEIYDAIQSAKTEIAALVQQAVPSVPGMIAVLGGTLPQTSEMAGEKVSTFYIGKYEVTWDEWQEVMAWAVSRGYDFANVGEGSGGNHPVRNVNWYDVVKWCNAKSEMDQRVPMYHIEGQVYRVGQVIPSLNLSGIDINGSPQAKPNGYRLPTEAEWEWASRGGVSSQGYTYSGSNDLNSVAWYWDNSMGAAVALSEGRGTWPVGQKAANELSIHDMSGNVWEWCFDGSDLQQRNLRGGSWYYNNDWWGANVSYRHMANPDHTFYSIGFRLARSY